MTSRIRRFLVGLLATSGILIASAFAAQAGGHASATAAMKAGVVTNDSIVKEATFWNRRHHRRWRYRGWKHRRWHKPRYYRGYTYYSPYWKRRHWKRRHWRWKRRHGYGYRSLK